MTPTPIAPDSSYSIAAEPAGPARAGESLDVMIVIRAVEPYHMTDGFPVALDVTGSSGVAISQSAYRLEDARVDRDAARFVVSVTPTRPGTHELAADAYFSVCSATQCLTRRERIGWTILAE